MDLSSITPQQKMLGAAGASVLFAIAMLFFPWAGAADISVNGMDVLPSSWLFLILTLVAAGVFAAAAFDYELPVPLSPLGIATYCVSVPTVITIALVLEGGQGRKFGLFLAALFGLAAVVLGGWVWREEEG